MFKKIFKALSSLSEDVREADEAAKLRKSLSPKQRTEFDEARRQEIEAKKSQKRKLHKQQKQEAAHRKFVKMVMEEGEREHARYQAAQKPHMTGTTQSPEDARTVLEGYENGTYVHLGTNDNGADAFMPYGKYQKFKKNAKKAEERWKKWQEKNARFLE